MGGDVAGGVDVGIGAAQVASTAIPPLGQLEPGRVGQRDVRVSADTDQDVSAGTECRRLQLDTEDAGLTGEAVDPDTESQVDTMITMERGEVAPTCSPTTRIRGWDRGSIIVTSAPCGEPRPPTSQPIQPGADDHHGRPR